MESRIPLSAFASSRRSQETGIPLDQLGRTMHDLRISVTDRCNFRCTYCMPRDKFGREHAFVPRANLLTFEEILRVVHLARAHGIRKVRLTGGEPLLRHGLPRLVEMLRGVDGLEVTLTTNGSLLARHAQALHDAGLHRLTVSLDALDDALFRRMNDVDYPVTDVLDGIDAAMRAGFTGTKINTVVRRGLNDNAILDMARHFRGSGHILRFIEFMDVGNTNGWRLDEVVSAREIIDRVGAEFPIEPLDAHYAGEVAERWRYKDGAGEIGVIASVTHAFCRSCTRLRLSPEGRLFTCLFAGHGHDLRALLRSDADDTAISTWLGNVWRAREDRYSELRGQASAPSEKIEMSYIGG